MSWEERNENCPCKRVHCERLGDCEACKEHHRTVETRYKVACERIAERKAKRRATAEKTGKRKTLT